MQKQKEFKVQLRAVVKEPGEELTTLNIPTPRKFFSDETLLSLTDNYGNLTFVGESFIGHVKEDVLPVFEHMLKQSPHVHSVSVDVSTDKYITSVKMRVGTDGTLKHTVNKRVHKVRTNTCFVNNGNIVAAWIGERRA